MDRSATVETRVYLAGGMHSTWRNKVKKCCPHLEFVDPCDHRLTQPMEYTLWDLSHLSRCHLLFGYMENNNPSGVGLSLEVGFAKARGIPIILVDEKFDKYFAIVRSSADITMNSLDEGILLLSRWGLSND